MLVIVLSYLLEVLAMLFCIHYLYGKTLKFDWLTCSYILLEVLWMSMVFILQLDQRWTMLMHLVTIIYCSIKFGFHLKTILINNILCACVMVFIQALQIIAFTMLLGIQKTSSIENFIINLIMFLFTKFCLQKCKLKELSDTLQNNDRIIWQSLTIVGICVVCFMLIYKQKNKFDLFYFLVLGVSIGLIILVAIDIGKQKVKTKEMEAELRLHKLYESSFKELIDEISAKQHEFDNHINAIYGQHRMYKTYEELVAAQEKYCGEVVEENHFNKILTKGNPVILCFLYGKMAEIKRKGIEVIYQVNIGDLECGMPTHKMIELLGNLINNAIEASEKRELKKIRIDMSEEMKEIFLEIANESDKIEAGEIKEFFRRGYSEKGKKRGYGLYNVQRICEEYHAAITCKNENRNGENWFVFKVIINKPL